MVCAPPSSSVIVNPAAGVIVQFPDTSCRHRPPCAATVRVPLTAAPFGTRIPADVKSICPVTVVGSDSPEPSTMINSALSPPVFVWQINSIQPETVKEVVDLVT